LENLVILEASMAGWESGRSDRTEGTQKHGEEIVHAWLGGSGSDMVKMHCDMHLDVVGMKKFFKCRVDVVTLTKHKTLDGDSGHSPCLYGRVEK
jgi:hypothetical protein